MPIYSNTQIENEFSGSIKDVLIKLRKADPSPSWPKNVSTGQNLISPDCGRLL